MMEYTLLKSALWGNKTQKMLAFLTIFLASMLVASMLNITLGIGDKVALELRSYGSNIIVLPKGGALSMEIEGKTFKPLQEKGIALMSSLVYFPFSACAIPASASGAIIAYPAGSG